MEKSKSVLTLANKAVQCVPHDSTKDSDSQGHKGWVFGMRSLALFFQYLFILLIDLVVVLGLGCDKQDLVVSCDNFPCITWASELRAGNLSSCGTRGSCWPLI